MRMKSILLLLVVFAIFDQCSGKKSSKTRFFKKAHKKLQKAHTEKLVPSLPMLGVAGPYNQLELQKAPILVPLPPLPPKAPLPAILPLDGGKINGRHSYNQMLGLFTQYGMTSGQVKGVYNTIDRNKSNILKQKTVW